MAETIATLKDERVRLLARLDQLDGLLSRYEEWEREAAVVLSGAAKAAASAPVSTVSTPSEPKETGTPVREFEAVATKMFEETPEPLARGDAFAKLAAMGVVVVGTEPANVMTTRFNRMDNIINLRGFGYWLKSRPYPPAGYKAELADLYTGSAAGPGDNLADLLERSKSETPA